MSNARGRGSSLYTYYNKFLCDFIEQRVKLQITLVMVIGAACDHHNGTLNAELELAMLQG